ncbi:hypothetical protein JW835_14435 [bacterium]|nr:hypothetical protein [bacterium]
MIKRDRVMCCVTLILVLISGVCLAQTPPEDKSVTQNQDQNEVQKPLAKHKNSTYILTSHMPNRSTSAVTLYDFTVVDSIYGGASGAKELEPGVWGMICGDANGDGAITAVDKNLYWRPNNGLIGYLDADLNLDGAVTAVDKNLYWRPNNGLSTVVP